MRNDDKYLCNITWEKHCCAGAHILSVKLLSCSSFTNFLPYFIDTSLVLLTQNCVCVQEFFAIVNDVISVIEYCGLILRSESEEWTTQPTWTHRTGPVMLIATPAHPCWLLSHHRFFHECSLTLQVKTETDYTKTRNEAGGAVHPETQRHTNCPVMLTTWDPVLHNPV